MTGEVKGVNLQLPADLVAELTRLARERAVGRNLLAEHVLRAGLQALPPVEAYVRPPEAPDSCGSCGAPLGQGHLPSCPYAEHWRRGSCGYSTPPGGRLAQCTKPLHHVGSHEGADPGGARLTWDTGDDAGDVVVW